MARCYLFTVRSFVLNFRAFDDGIEPILGVSVRRCAARRACGQPQHACWLCQKPDARRARCARTGQAGVQHTVNVRRFILKLLFMAPKRKAPAASTPADAASPQAASPAAAPAPETPAGGEEPPLGPADPARRPRSQMISLGLELQLHPRSVRPRRHHPLPGGWAFDLDVTGGVNTAVVSVYLP